MELNSMMEKMNLFKHMINERLCNFVSRAGRSRLAFTLAEVLITLGIIGVVAAITIPTMLQNQQEKATVESLKKAYTTLSQAFALAVQENGNSNTWGVVADNQTGSRAIADKLIPYLKVEKDCGDSAGCFPDTLYKTLDGSYDDYQSLNNMGGVTKLQLSGGYLVVVDSSDTLGNAFIVVDTNGFKGPNQFGRDTFVFRMTFTKITPGGAPLNSWYSFPDNCSTAIVGGGNGRGCAAWVIYNNNMEYLHCSDLTWSGKSTCN